MKGIYCLSIWITLISLIHALNLIIDEDQPPNHFVADLSAITNLTSVVPPGTEITYSFFGNKDHEYFQLNSSTGVLVTGSNTDRDIICRSDSTCEINVKVVALASHNSLSEIINIWITLKDRNDHSPEFASDVESTQISEFAEVGTSIGLPTATDRDSGINDIQRYYLESSPYDSKFELKFEQITGYLMTVSLELKEKLDAESMAGYNLTLVAVDGGDPARSGSIVVEITVQDANDNSIEFPQSQYVHHVKEDSVIGSSILQVTASDADVGIYGEISYSLRAQDPPEPFFSITERGGVIQVSKVLDYEKTSTHHLLIEASDDPDGHPAVVSLTIHIQDVNDNPPTITVNYLTGNLEEAQVNENSNVGTEIALVLVEDEDSSSITDITCNLDDAAFSLKEESGQDYFRVVTNSELDREQKEEYEMRVYCYDGGISPLMAVKQIRVRVIDVNDHTPVFSKEFYNANIQENMQIGSSVIKVNATDLDLDLNSDIRYSLQGPDAAFFTVTPSSGIIKATNVFDFETRSHYAFRVVAKDRGTPPLNASVPVTISIIDTNDNAPEFNQTVYDFYIEENKHNGSVIGKLTAFDVDSYPYNHLAYSLSQTDLFSIDSKTGMLKSLRLLDREDISTYHLTVYATNTAQDSNHLQGEAAIIIHVTDKNDNWPSISFPSEDNNTAFINNKVPFGYEVIRIDAIDIDEGVNSELVYSLTGGRNQELFSVDYSTGVISTIANLAEYNNEVLDLVVAVSDQGLPSPHMSTSTLYIHVNDSVPFSAGSHLAVEDKKLLLQGTHLTIVIVLAVVSAVIVVILVVAIVLVKRQDRQKRASAYKEQVHSVKNWVNTQNNAASTGSVITSGTSTSKSTGSDKSGSKLVSDYWTSEMRDTGNSFPAHLAATQQIQDYPSQRSATPQQLSQCSQSINRSNPRSQSFTSRRIQNQPEEPKKAARSSLRYDRNLRPIPQKDTDSSCSNDSGRGCSVEGEHNLASAKPSPNYPIPHVSNQHQPAASTYQVPQRPPICSYSRGFTVSALPLLGQTQPPQRPYSPCPSHLKKQGSTQYNKPPLPSPGHQIGGNLHNRQQLLDPQRLPKATPERQPSYRYKNSNCNNSSKNIYHDNYGYQGNSLRDVASSIYTSHDEMYGDNASTTSGSYFVNLNDFDDEMVEPPGRSVEV